MGNPAQSPPLSRVKPPPRAGLRLLATFCHILPYLATPCHILSYFVISCHMFSYFLLSLSLFFSSYLVMFCHIFSYLLISSQIFVITRKSFLRFTGYSFSNSRLSHILSHFAISFFIPLYLAIFVHTFRSSSPRHITPPHSVPK